MKRPKIGIGFFASDWFLKNPGERNKIIEWMESDRKKIIKILETDNDLIYSDFISSCDKADKEALKFLYEDVDAIIIVYLVWGEDELILPFINKLKHKTFIIWNFYPYDKFPEKETDPLFTLYSYGSLGSLQAATVLRRLNKEIFFITANFKDIDAIKKIKKIVRIAKLRKNLKNLHLGLLPYRSDIMLDTYINEFKLITEIGPKIKYISIAEYKNIIGAVPEDKVLGFVQELKDNYTIDTSVDDMMLAENARISLGLESLLDFYELDGLSINDECYELFNEIGLKPALHTKKFCNEKKIVTVEGDISFTISMYILKEIANDYPMMLEVKAFDRNNNDIIFGHGGPVGVYSLVDNSKNIIIKRDIEAESWMRSLMTEMKAKAGKVTLFNISSFNNNFQFACLSGYSCGGKSEMSYPHMRIKFNSDIDKIFEFFYENKISHHWAVAFGEFSEDLKILAKILNFNIVTM